MTDTDQVTINEWVEKEEHLIAYRLHQVRIKFDIDRHELARIVNISESELADYENGVEVIPASILFMIATAIGVDVGYFYGGENLIDCATGIYGSSVITCA